MTKLLKAFKDPLWVMSVILRRLSPLIKNDEKFIRIEYYLGMHKKLNLNNPQTFNEKLQWLKLHDKHEEYTSLVDKHEVKKIVSNILGDQYIIPTIGVWDNVEDIDFDKLPSSFVLKTTHDSGGVVVCKDKSKLDIVKAKRKLKKSLRHNFYWEHREYPYKDVKPRIIAEKYMVDESGSELKDYKFFCFDGEPKMLYIATDRPYDTRFDFFDIEFNHLPFKQGHPTATKTIVKPEGFDDMVKIATRLSQGFRHVRIDLYNINGKIYFGEYTFFHFSGNVPFDPEEWDYRIGEMLKLPI